MNITQSALDMFFRQADLRFGKALASTPVWFSQVATLVPSSTRENTYGWMAKLPSLREWVGERTVHAISTHARRVVNKGYELTDGIMSEDIRHDQFGLFNMNLDLIAQQAKKWPDHQLRDFIYNNGELGYDGKYQFATDHPTLGGDVVGPDTSTQSNLFTGTALTFDNYAAVRAAMMSFKGEDGKPLSVVPDTLMVPPALESRAKLILESDFMSGILANTTAPQSNIWKNSAKLLVNPDLRSATYWYLLDTSKPVKPWIWQQEMAPRFTYMVNPNDWNVFTNRKFLYGVEAWGAPAETLWWLAAAATA